MRTITSGIATAIPAQGSFLGYLAQITTNNGQVLRLCSMDVDFQFGGFTFSAANLAVGNMTWDGGVNRPAAITIGDPDLSYWALVLNLALTDAPVTIWEVYASASGEGVPLWTGRVGKAGRAGLAVQLTLTNGSDTTYSPRTRIQQYVNNAYMIPAGTGITIGGQRWIIERPGQ